MKTIILFALIFLSKINFSFSQGGMYIVTTKGTNCTLAGTQTFEAIVTSPSGVTTNYTLPHQQLQTEAYFSELNLIFTGIINQGYKMVPLEITPAQNSLILNNCSTIILSYLFAQP